MLQSRVSAPESGLRPERRDGRCVFVFYPTIYIFGRFMAWILGLQKKKHCSRRCAVEFALNEVEPIAAEIDAARALSGGNRSEADEVRTDGHSVPEGSRRLRRQLRLLLYRDRRDEPRMRVPPAAIISAHGTLGAWPIYAFGTPEQKEKWLRPLIDRQGRR